MIIDVKRKDCCGKWQINLHVRLLIRNFELRSKILTLGKWQINLHVRSLIRIFARRKRASLLTLGHSSLLDGPR